VHHFAPPLLAERDAQGHLKKKAYGPWLRKLLPWLARCKGLRGTALDPFGRTGERRTERALIVEYRERIDELLQGLDAASLPQALEIARVAEEIRGFGHVKDASLAAARIKWDRLMSDWRGRHAPQPARGAQAA
jgi:indolepyruvate ferredoxin oxidoreductase